jgi:hypothetical protein
MQAYTGHMLVLTTLPFFFLYEDIDFFLGTHSIHITDLVDYIARIPAFPCPKIAYNTNEANCNLLAGSLNTKREETKMETVWSSLAHPTGGFRRHMRFLSLQL